MERDEPIFKKVAGLIDVVINNSENEAELNKVRTQVKAMMAENPLYK